MSLRLLIFSSRFLDGSREGLEKSLDLTIKQLPSEIYVAGFTLSALWHERTQHDAAHKWFRGVVDEVARTT